MKLIKPYLFQPQKENMTEYGTLVLPKAKKHFQEKEKKGRYLIYLLEIPKKKRSQSIQKILPEKEKILKQKSVLEFKKPFMGWKKLFH